MTAPTTASRDDWSLHLARFINSLRPDWEMLGIRSAIHNARTLGSHEDVAIAAIELTRRDDLRTPALLAQDGPHWHTGRTPNVRILRTRCDKPGHEHEDIPCHLCPVEHLEPSDAPTLGISAEQAARNTAWAARVRAVIHQQQTDQPYYDHAMAAAGETKE